MKFLQYINENSSNLSVEEVLNAIYDNSQLFLKDIVKRGVNIPVLYSGRKTGRGDMFIKQVRKNRIPKDMPLYIHNALDDTFNRKFGFRARSNALFVVSDDNVAAEYGKVYMIFPVGRFKYLYNENIDDLLHSIDTYRDEFDQEKWASEKYADEIEKELEDAYEKYLKSDDVDFTKLPDSAKDQSKKFFFWKQKKKIIPRIMRNFKYEDKDEIGVEIIKEWAKDNLSGYSTRNLQKAIDRKVEVMLGCDEYLAVDAGKYETSVISYFSVYGLQKPTREILEEWYRISGPFIVPRNSRLLKDS